MKGLYPKDMNEFEKWKLRTVAFFEKNYGEDNVMSVEVHMDETIPHLHALCSAIYKDKDGVNRLSYRKVSDGLEGRLHSYRALQTEYAKQFEDMGYNRGAVGDIGFAHGEALIDTLRAIGQNDGKRGMFGKIAAVEIGAKAAEHTAVLGVVAVEYGIGRIKAILAAAVHEDCAQSVALALKCRF